MLKTQITLHQLQIEKVNLAWLSPEILMVIDNMKNLIDELIKENKELESIVNEESVNLIGRI